MEEGYVSLNSINMVIYGPPGVGKTSFQDLLLNKPPRKEYKSTPIARQIQAIEKIAANGDKSWEKVTPDDLLEMLNAATKKGKPTQSIPTSRASLEEPDTAVAMAADTATTPETEDDTKHSSSTTDDTRSMDKDYTSDIITRLAGRKGSQKLLEATWIHLLDSGGQPQFADLLHMFVRDNSLYIIVMKATESLHDKPVIVYSFDGTPVSDGNQATQASPSTKMIMTNLQNIKNFVCSVIKASRSTIKAGGEVINQPLTPAFAIIVTHCDKYEQQTIKNETLEEKNEILKDSFKDIFAHFIYNCDCEKHDTNSNECQLIFPVNNHCESKDRESLSAGIRKRFMSRFGTFVPQEIPACYYIFEIKMNEASEKCYGMISKDSCVNEIGKKLGMDESEVKDCLEYLDSLRICIYYSYVLPHVVFTDAQFLIDCLSKIVRVSIVDDVQQILPKGVSLSTEAIRNLKGSGIFEDSLLDCLKLTFDSSLFTKDNLLSLLEQFHIVSPIPADTIPKQYFMPTLLPPETLTDEEKNDLKKSKEQLIIASPGSPLKKVHAYTVH